uniref:hypothetical protein n=1 Tax=Cupriavidus necator TaxID=106590 RepID=UPI003FA42099
MRAVHFTLACVSEYESQALRCPRLKMLDSISTGYRSGESTAAVKPKLVAVKEQLRRRMHQTIAQQGI